MCINHDGVAVPVVGIGAFHAALILDLTVVEAKIANLAVTEAKIGALAVTSAKIGLLAVEEANIKLLNVTTITIANDATKIFESYFASGNSSFFGTAYGQITDSLPIASIGGPIVIKGSCVVENTDSSSRWATLELYQSAVGIKYASTIEIPPGEEQTWSAEITLTPGSGAKTFLIRTKAEVSSKVRAKYRSLVLQEDKGK